MEQARTALPAPGETTSLQSRSTSTSAAKLRASSVYRDLLSRSKTDDPDEENKTRKRAAAVAALIARFELLSGVTIEPERKKALMYELELRRIKKAELDIAETWIIESQTRYGSLTLADFYPTHDQLERLGRSVARIIAMEYDKGYMDGRRMERRYCEEITGTIIR